MATHDYQQSAGEPDFGSGTVDDRARAWIAAARGTQRAPIEQPHMAASAPPQATTSRTADRAPIDQPRMAAPAQPRVAAAEPPTIGPPNTPRTSAPKRRRSWRVPMLAGLAMLALLTGLAIRNSRRATPRPQTLDTVVDRSTAATATTAKASSAPSAASTQVVVSTTDQAPVTIGPAVAPASVTFATTVVRSTTSVPQVQTPKVGASPEVRAAASALRSEWAAAPGVPLILTYHDLSPDSTSNYTVTPAQFADQMAALAELGVHTLSAAEFSDYLAGKSIPPRSVLLTFDDGTKGVWKYAEPILAQHNFRAVAYIVTGFVGTRQPYYMTWDEISGLAATGRWEFENHTHEGHLQIAITAAGTKSSFLRNLAWLPNENRLETLTEFRVRVGTDLDRAIVELKSRGYGRSMLFAFPYSDFGVPGNHPETAPILTALVKERFQAVFNDDTRPLPLLGPFLFNRLGASSKMTPVSLLEGLRTMLQMSFSKSAVPPPK